MLKSHENSGSLLEMLTESGGYYVHFITHITHFRKGNISKGPFETIARVSRL